MLGKTPTSLIGPRSRSETERAVKAAATARDDQRSMMAAESVALRKRGAEAVEKFVDKLAHLADSMRKIAKTTGAR